MGQAGVLVQLVMGLLYRVGSFRSKSLNGARVISPGLKELHHGCGKIEEQHHDLEKGA